MTLTNIKVYCKFIPMKARLTMTRINTLIENIRRGLGGSPVGSQAFYGAIATARSEGVPTYAESRQDYSRMVGSREIYPFT